MTPAEPPDPAPDRAEAGTRARILAATAGLIAAGGPDAATTRAVAGAAGVQAPTIYRLFGDKRGLLDAVAERELAAYMEAKAAQAPHPDPVEGLREGWDAHVAFGLAHPGLFGVIHGGAPRTAPPAVETGLAVLRGRVRVIARSGRLRVGEARAVALLQAAHAGTVLTLLGQPEGARDMGLSAAAREAVLAAITVEGSGVAGGARVAASALRASLDEARALSPGERHLLGELLDRIANEG